MGSWYVCLIVKRDIQDAFKIIQINVWFKNKTDYVETFQYINKIQ